MIRPKMMWLTSLSLGVVLAGCGGGEQSQPAADGGQPAATQAAQPVDPATAATIVGKVSFEGTQPNMPRIRMDAVPACTQANPEPVFSEEVVVNDNGTLRDVFIYVKEGLGDRAFPVPSEPAVLDQHGCQYTPHVIGLMVGQKLQIKNSDPTNHNVHPTPVNNREWNQSQPPGAPDLMQEFARPEVMVPIKCNVHPWMKAYVGVQRHPFFAVTGTDGSFTIQGLPPGDYTLEAWHERYGTQEIQVTVGPQESKTADFTYRG